MATEDNTTSSIIQEIVNNNVLCPQLDERFSVNLLRGGGKNGYPQSSSSVSVTPYLVDFSGLVKQRQIANRCTTNAESDSSVIPGIATKDLLHAVVGLYDVCLTELTPDVLYSTVCDNCARTIVLVRDVKDVFLEFEKRRDRKQRKAAKIAEVPAVGEGEEDVYQSPEAEPSTFSVCYSDSSSSEEEESDDEDDYSTGINTYRAEAMRRRKNRDNHTGPFTTSHVGPENRIVAACTFDHKYLGSSAEKIVHLTLLSVRKRFRHAGLGKYLVKQVKNPSTSGPHDAVVVHAESEAASFFVRCGFSDDLILNSKWKEIAEQFTNCMLLTYVAPYAGQNIPNMASDIDLITLDLDLRKWKDQSLASHQSQITVIERMKVEMMRLRAMLASQDNTIRDLRSKVTLMEANQVETDKELMRYKIRAKLNCSGDDVDSVMSPSSSPQQRYQVVSTLLPEDSGDTSSSPAASNNNSLLTADVEQELRRYVVMPDNSSEIYDHGKDIAQFHRICEDFKSSIRKDENVRREYTVTSVSKALLTSTVISQYAGVMRSLGDKSPVMKLYYCGSMDHPERLEQILKDGFSEQDTADGDYGKGLYFSRYASTAVHFAPPNKVLVAEVAAGKCQTLVTKDKGRQSPDTGYNSVLCPGRLAVQGSDGLLVQEYVIFDCCQALPLDLIEYSTLSAAKHYLSSSTEQQSLNGDQLANETSPPS